MTFVLKIKLNIQNFMRQAGYFFNKSAFAKATADEARQEMSFIRPLTASRSGYPCFHIYLKFDKVSREAEINLHLDQKKTVYQGVSAHAGEYKGGLVEKEAERIKQILKQ